MPDAVLHGIALSILCVISYWLITHMLPHTLSISQDDDLLVDRNLALGFACFTA
jgi:hypothetical protein